MKTRKLFIIFSLLSLITGCTNENPRESFMWQPDPEIDTLAPHPMFLRNLPPTTDSYGQGFRDGCYTYIGMTGEGMNRFYPYMINNERSLQDGMYRRGMEDGRGHCMFFMDNAPN